MTPLKIFFGLFFLVTSLSCSSYFTRKSCEKINWFQYAHDIAMRGQRLEEDPRLKECQKAETEINSGELDRGFKHGMQNYCKLDTAHEKGAAGDSYNYEFCDSGLIPRLRARHAEGIKKFCTPESAYSFASKGGIYKEQCPKDLEIAYLPRYKKGRQVYLRNKIASNESQIKGIDTELTLQQSRIHQITQRITSLPRTRVTSKTRTYDEATKTYKEQTAVTEDPEITRQRQGLEYELRQANEVISIKQKEQRALREEIHKLQSELEGLS